MPLTSSFSDTSVVAPSHGDSIVAGKEGDVAQIIPVVHEFVDVQRRSIETGLVQITKTVSTESVSVSDSVVHEFVETERVPIGRLLDVPAVVRHEGDVMILPVVEERVVITRQLFLVEEIRVTRKRESRPFEQQVELRREAVHVRRFDNRTQQWQAEEDIAPIQQSHADSGGDKPSLPPHALSNVEFQIETLGGDPDDNEARAPPNNSASPS